MFSGMVWFHTVERNSAEIMSAPPASAKNSIATQIDGASPASAMNPP